jgi:hypothetical protein
MRRFVPGGLRSLGNQVRVPIRPDDDGYLGRECPNSECEEYFKITPGTGITTPAPCHCPYCGHTGDPQTFWTKEQIKYIESFIKRKIDDAMYNELKAMEFEVRPRGPIGIGVSFKVRRQGAPASLRWYREKNLETPLTCDQCGLRYAIYGVFAWCPDCGVHNSLQILAKNLETATKRLALAQSEKDLAEDLVADALSGIVSGFDGFGRELCTDGDNRASFQNLEGGRKRVQQKFGFDMSDAVTEEEWRSACRSFQKRHLIAHRTGVVDEEYVQKACDPSAVIGRKVMLPPEEVTALVSIVERIGKLLYEGVMSTKK